jgi:hypothetical protein
VAGPGQQAEGGSWRGLSMLVGLVALAAYVWTAAATPYLLDSAELAAAGFGLGVAHPPGEPLALLWAKLHTLLPLGSIAFRVAVSQAVAGAAAAALTFHLALSVIERSDPEGWLGPATRALLAATAALAFALAPGVVQNANRPEVYALATALALAALVVAGSMDARGALLGALLIGIGLTNHPFVAGLAGLGAVAAALPLLHTVEPIRRLRLVALAVAALVVGLMVLAYLPARAVALHAPGAAPDSIIWGDARTFAGFWWIVSGRTFLAKSSVVQAGSEPEALPFALAEEIGLPLVLLALAGLMYAVRSPSARRLGLPIAAGLAGSSLAAVGAGFDPRNPDSRGYLGVALAATAILGAAGLTALGAATRRRWIAVAGTVALAGGTALHSFPVPARVDLRQARTADRVTHDLFAEAPARAVLFSSHHETGFLLAYQRLVEGRRPDAAWIHLGFVRGPGYADRMGAAYPELAPVLADHRTASLGAEPLRRLSRPALIEPDEHLHPRLLAELVPAGRLWRVGDERPVAPGAGTAPLPPEARQEATTDRQVRGYLGWRAYRDGELACRLGLTALAKQRLAELHQLLPGDERARALRASCLVAPQSQLAP